MEQITRHLLVFLLFMVRPCFPARLGGDQVQPCANCTCPARPPHIAANCMLSTACTIKFELILRICVYICFDCSGINVVWNGSCVEPQFVQSDHTVVSVIISLLHQVILAYGIRT
jgi:hypothetical protein